MGLIRLTVEQEFTTLDLLLWRRFGYEIRGAVEKTLARNAALAEQGVFLPVGAVVEVETEDMRAPAQTRVVRLWN